MPKNKEPAYDASAIQQLRGLEAVRKRPGMYLGDVHDGSALHKLIDEVVDNSVDEHLAGHCDTIEVTIGHGERVDVTDNGRGIPVDTHAESGLSALELVMCNLHAGGKFGNTQVSAGLHGVGVAAVNAVSRYVQVFVHRGGRFYEQNYERGVPTGPVLDHGPDKAGKRGTYTSFVRDEEIFSGVTSYDASRVARRLEELAFLNPGLTIRFADSRKNKAISETFKYDGGIEEYLVQLLGKKKAVVPPVRFRDGLGHVDVAMAWTDRDGEDLRCYANNTFNSDGGTHLAGFKNSLTRLVTAFAREHGLLKGLSDEGITGPDIREGIVAIVSVKMPDLSFSSQTKEKLVSQHAKAAVEALFQDQVAHFFAEHPAVAKRIAERAVLSAKAREAARRAREQVKRKEWLDVSSLPGKLADCQSRVAEECELFLVEGDSAGGSSKSARDRRYQAILPLRGKVLNVERVALETLLENKELGTVITALGCGIEQNGSFNIDKLRYHKIVLMADADVDGAHIRTLLLTFLFRCMPRLIYGGHIYIAMPPLFGARLTGTKNNLFFTTERDLNDYRDMLTEEQRQRFKVSRYKGLGEMNAEELAVTTMEPENRTLKQVTVQDAIGAELLFEVLMGDDVPVRREFIEEHALSAHLDI